MSTNTTVLVIDDEKNIRRTLKMVLESEGYDVIDAESAEEGLSILDTHIGCILLDLKLPGMTGMEALATLQRNDSYGETTYPVIMISGHGTVADAVQATRLGAFDFIEKPLDRERIVITVRNALNQSQMASEVGRLRKEVAGRFEMIGESPVMKQLFKEISKVAPTKGRVLITGESGSGKELIARAIHENSPLSKGPFIKVNCAAIPPELIESELFGHERGAFTGATNRKRGLFEVANGGSIFLDEIGDMSLSAQAKVLRALQMNELTRVGGEKTIKFDTRVIAATNKDLAKEVKNGSFREDLYFRLNVIPLIAPPLAERKDDIPLMVEHFVAQFCRENGFRSKNVAADVFQKLQHYHWPGNVRELKNIIERLVIMSDDIIVAEDLPDYLSKNEQQSVNIDQYSNCTLKEFKEETEKDFLISRLEQFDWNISKTAISLGIERTNLHKKLKAFGISRH